MKYKGDSKYSQQRAEKMERRRALLAQLATAKSDVQHLGREVERMQTEIINKGNQLWTFFVDSYYNQ